MKLVVKKDKTDQPHEGEMNIAFNLLGEIRKRAQLRLEFLKKADRYERDIQEYLQSLEGRGVICPLVKPVKKEVFSTNTNSAASVDPFEKAKREAKK